MAPKNYINLHTKLSPDITHFHLSLSYHLDTWCCCASYYIAGGVISGWISTTGLCSHFAALTYIWQTIAQILAHFSKRLKIPFDLQPSWLGGCIHIDHREFTQHGLIPQTPGRLMLCWFFYASIYIDGASGFFHTGQWENLKIQGQVVCQWFPMSGEWETYVPICKWLLIIIILTLYQPAETTFKICQFCSFIATSRTRH